MSNRFNVFRRSNLFTIVDSHWSPGKQMVAFNDYEKRSDAQKICAAANKLYRAGKDPREAHPKFMQKQPRQADLELARDTLERVVTSRGKLVKRFPLTQPDPCPPTMPPPPKPRPVAIPIPPAPMPKPFVPVPPAPQPRVACPLPPKPQQKS